MMTLTLAEYIEKNNSHYYATRDPLGVGGDFITAPEISQIFGEAIGLWCANEWLRLGSPPAFTLLEMGGGRGTLMQDALRAMAQVLPEYTRALRLHMLETSPLLRAKQQEKLAKYNPQFLSSLTGCHPERSEGPPLNYQGDPSATPQDDKPECVLPLYPTIIIANEFFDALPVNQYRCINGEWQMRGVADNNFIEISIDESSVPSPIKKLSPSAWAEYSETSVTIMQTLAAHIAAHGGALLAIDYGYTHSAAGDTLQAVKAHRYTNPLENFGAIDLTTHVNFEVLANAASPLQTTITTQAEFLHALGGRERLAALCANKDSATQAMLRTGYARLTDADQMGELFKVLVTLALH